MDQKKVVKKNEVAADVKENENVSRETVQVEMPLILKFYEAKRDISTAINKAINEYNVPFFMLENIMNEFMNVVSNQSTKEYEKANEYYVSKKRETDMNQSAN